MRKKQRRKDKIRTVTVRGIVEILGDDGSPFDAVLVADNDEEFFINVPGGKPNPADYADQYVQISGLIYEQEGYMSIVARKISIIDSMAEYSDFEERDEWYEEDYEEDYFDHYLRSSGRSGGGGFSMDY